MCVQYRYPGGINDQTTVQVGCVLLSVDVQGFQYFHSPVVLFHFSCLGCFPVHLVLVCPGVDCDSIPGIMLLRCILMFAQSLFKGSTCLSNVNTFTILYGIS